MLRPRMRPSPVAATLASVAVLIGAAGCADGNGDGDASVTAVATTTQVGDFVRNVGGGRVGLDTVLRPNSDPHEYEPRPSDAAALAKADVVFRSGGDLDEWLDEVVDSAGGDATQVTLIDEVERIGDDPHWWEDPRNAILAVAAIRDALVDADPGGRAGYERRAAAYTARLRRLDAGVARCMDRIPPAKRKLVTTHDALGYFADRYGIEVVGAVIPSLSSQAQPSAKDVEELVDQIKDEGVEAIFPEAALSKKLEQAISRESGARVGGQLWADTLGPPGSSGATYVDAIEANAQALADGMSGGEVSCDFSR
jgi:ABC-type Zn uptake system ZnuABC Zn-binding protein ZnuA